MKFKVSWDETVRHETTVEAETPEEAKDIVCSGMEVEEDETANEFNCVTEVVAVEAVTPCPTISAKHEFMVPVTYTVTGWVKVKAESLYGAAQEAKRLNDEGVEMFDIEDASAESECHVDGIEEMV